MIGLSRDDRHRYTYEDEKGRVFGPFPSVTSVIRVVDKSGPLTAWAKRETATSAIRNIDMLERMVRDGGKDAAISWLSGIPDYQRDTKADLGSRVHKLAENWPGIAPMQPDEEPLLRQYEDFRNRVQPVVTHVETLVMNTDLGIGGTFDIGCLIDGHPTMLDIKTSRGVYAETALQLAGYAEGQFTTVPGDPVKVPLPAWDRFGVLHLRVDGWTLIPFTVDSETRAAFRAAISLYGWTTGQAKWVRGEPIEGSAA